MSEWDPDFLAAIERRQCELIAEGIAREHARLRSAEWRQRRRERFRRNDPQTGKPKPNLSQATKITYADLQKKIAARGA